MKKLILVLLLPLMAFAASEQRIEKDKVVIGRPSPAGDPVLEFKSTTQRIKANRATGRMQFTNDGTNFKNIGSGSGGAGGVNLLTDDNGDFEAGDTAWTESGGTFSIETTNPLFGVGSGKWDSSASAQTLISNLKTIEKGMVGRTCLAEMVYKWPSGVAADLSFQVLDASNNIILTNDLTPTTGDNVVKTQRNFDCGVLGSQYRISILSNVANPAEIIIDNIFLGSDSNSANISQSGLAGESVLAITGSCSWTRTNATLGAFGATAACPGPTIKAARIGTWLTTDADTPAQTINNLPAGVYRATYYFRTAGASALALFAINDGTTTCEASSGEDSNSASSGQSVSCTFTYTTPQLTKTFQLFGSSASGAVTVGNNASATRFFLEYSPLSASEAITLETSGWLVDATVSGSAVISSGTVALPGVSLDSATASIAANTSKGSLPVEIPCSSTNPSTGTTCAVGNENNGVVFIPPTSGLVDVCVTGVMGLVSNSLDNTIGLDIVSTANNSQTTIESGLAARISVGGNTPAANDTLQLPFALCGVLSANAGVKNTFRLNYTKSNATTGTASPVAGQRWTVRPRNQQMPAPVFTELQNNMKAGANGVKTCAVLIENTAGTPSVISQASCPGWVASLTDAGAGVTTVNYAGGTWSATPACVATANEGTGVFAETQLPSSSSIQVVTRVATTGTVNDEDVTLICVGLQ